jgi:hypothetical protein
MLFWGSTDTNHQDLAIARDRGHQRAHPWLIILKVCAKEAIHNLDSQNVQYKVKKLRLFFYIPIQEKGCTM